MRFWMALASMLLAAPAMAQTVPCTTAGLPAGQCQVNVVVTITPPAGCTIVNGGPGASNVAFTAAAPLLAGQKLGTFAPALSGTCSGPATATVSDNRFVVNGLDLDVGPVPPPVNATGNTIFTFTATFAPPAAAASAGGK